MIYVERIANVHVNSPDDGYPYNIPSIRNLGELQFTRAVTFITGENGSGKSTLVEAIAVKTGLNPEGGSRNFNFATIPTHSSLYESLKISRGPHRERDAYFMRAESFYNVASEIERLAEEDWCMYNAYGGRSLHHASHGEGFISLFMHRLGGNALYLMDEPEAALSLTSMLAFMVRINQLAGRNSQFIIATHSPILLAYPDAEIFCITSEGLTRIAYEQTEQYRLTKYFLANHAGMLRELFAGEE